MVIVVSGEIKRFDCRKDFSCWDMMMFNVDHWVMFRDGRCSTQHLSMVCVCRSDARYLSLFVHALRGMKLIIIQAPVRLMRFLEKSCSTLTEHISIIERKTRSSISEVTEFSCRWHFCSLKWIRENFSENNQGCCSFVFHSRRNNEHEPLPMAQRCVCVVFVLVERCPITQLNPYGWLITRLVRLESRLSMELRKQTIVEEEEVENKFSLSFSLTAHWQESVSLELQMIVIYFMMSIPC